MNDRPVPTRRRFLALGLGAVAAAWGGALAASRDDDPCLIARPEARLAPPGAGAFSGAPLPRAAAGRRRTEEVACSKRRITAWVNRSGAGATQRASLI